EGRIRWQDIGYEPFLNADFLLKESKRLLHQVKKEEAPVAVACAPAPAAPDLKQIEAMLKHDLVTEAPAIAEVQRYCDDRIPRMGRYQSAAQWQAEADRIRSEVLAKVIFRGQAAQWRDMTARVEWLDTIPGGEGYTIKKLRYEAAPGMWIPAL